MTEQIRIGKTEEIPIGTAKIVEIKGEKVAVFNAKGEFYAISNTCAHRGGPLGEGFLNDSELTVECPWHGWVYSLETGESTSNPDAKVKTYPVIVKDGQIFVEA